MEKVQLNCYGQVAAKSEVEYRLGLTRTYLKKNGLLENSGRGVWAHTREGAEAGSMLKRSSDVFRKSIVVENRKMIQVRVAQFQLKLL